MAKKPDNIVYNEKTQTYDAFLKLYATNFTSRAIQADNLVSSKKQHIYTANLKFSSVFSEIKEQYQSLVEQYEYNEIIYHSKFNFEPIVGNVYHLYKRIDETFFLSILAPEECNFNLVGSFRLNSDKLWKKI